MTEQTLLELLKKQRIVEGMVRAQPGRRQELVETVVHNQHTVELKAVLARLSSGDVARTLTQIPAEDATSLWRLVDDAKREDVLWDIPNDLKRHLGAPMELRFEKARITAYEQRDGRVVVREIERPEDFDGLNPIWIDIHGASKPERNWIGRHFDIDLPNPEESTDLETSARFYVEDKDEIHLHSNFLFDREGDSRNIPVAFVIHNKILFSIRGEDLPVFRLQRIRARRLTSETPNCLDVLLDLYAADVEYSADSLEDVYDTLREIGREVLSENVSDADAARLLADIAEEEDLNGRIRGNLRDTSRAVSFLVRNRFLAGEQIEEAREISRDIESLNAHTAFLFEKINFLMDAIVGFININQNRRVTQLTVVSVVFMPLNVIAGVGGMSEFSMMTGGVDWPIAYGGLTVGLGVVAWMTYAGLKYLETRSAKKTVDRARAGRPASGQGGNPIGGGTSA